MDSYVLNHVMPGLMAVTSVAVAFHMGREWETDRDIRTAMFRRYKRQYKIRYRARRAFKA